MTNATGIANVGYQKKHWCLMLMVSTLGGLNIDKQSSMARGHDQAVQVCWFLLAYSSSLQSIFPKTIASSYLCLAKSLFFPSHTNHAGYNLIQREWCPPVQCALCPMSSCLWHDILICHSSYYSVLLHDGGLHVSEHMQHLHSIRGPCGVRTLLFVCLPYWRNTENKSSHSWKTLLNSIYY